MNANMNKIISKGQIKTVHIIASRMGWLKDRNIYETVLSLVGVRGCTSKNMTVEQFNAYKTIAMKHGFSF